ncbi:MAG: AEC family transporter [Candidatus Magnetominusculus sp. LBB02]|nr:AEC family transporter [Candidatus Magnetominusculus sp. LBB02]
MSHTLLSFGFIIAAGIVFRRLNAANAATIRHSINQCVFNVFLPALCITIFYKAKVDAEALLVPLTAAITIFICLAGASAIYIPLSKRIQLSRDETGILIIASAFGNVTYLGLPIVTELYGTAAAKYPIYYDLFATTPILWIVGAQIAGRFGGSGAAKPSVSDSVRTVVSLPPLWGCLTGAVFQTAAIAPPDFIMKALQMLGGLVTPLMIFSVGLAITLPTLKYAAASSPATLIKLVVSPLVGFAAARFLGLDGTALRSCAIEGAMPSMVLSLLIADKFNLNVPLAAFMIAATTALSFAVLPAAATLLSKI